MKKTPLIIYKKSRTPKEQVIFFTPESDDKEEDLPLTLCRDNTEKEKK